ncbi:LysR family transcriptional regulator [[Clostridium] symbiosum]|uniref:LysR family transcriptional regulator n=1 Tax=Clostridium symbiosum TaxID=1512 RepID=UPI001D088B55|nr:LysR family transcriptional regulator [[Clostridium] symbiosum]MCB6608526.1 LysR family transcriptional regulator [[Clostridium] symbiosum]MCB6932162.1 LysR family transcriptional regulator [[Clostridium] symbiosum]
MTLESYRNFIAIVECGSILAASNKLLIAQPSLSNQLKNIEAYYGAKLLIRNRHKLELTDAGRVFYLRAREICQAEEKLHNEIHNKKTAFSELLKLSIPAGNSAYFLHHLFDDFRAEYPNVNFDFYEIPSDFAIPNVLNHVTEIGLIRSNLPGYASLAVYPYEKETIVAICRPEHPLMQKGDMLDISQLADYPLAVPFDCLDLVRSSFGHCLLAPNISIITSSNATAIEWARSFGTVALASLTAADFQHIHDLSVKHFSDENLFITSAFIVNKEYPLSQAARNFFGFHGVDVE